MLFCSTSFHPIARDDDSALPPHHDNDNNNSDGISAAPSRPETSCNGSRNKKRVLKVETPPNVEDEFRGKGPTRPKSSADTFPRQHNNTNTNGRGAREEWNEYIPDDGGHRHHLHHHHRHVNDGDRNAPPQHRPYHGRDNDRDFNRYRHRDHDNFRSRSRPQYPAPQRGGFRPTNNTNHRDGLGDRHRHRRGNEPSTSW